MASSSAVGFTSGGIDVSSIVSGLMQVERQPVDRLINRQAEARAKSAAVTKVKSQLESLRTAARDVTIRGVGKMTSTVSNGAAVSLTTTSSAIPGTTSFTVDRLASTHSVRTSAPLPSASANPGISKLALSTSSTSLGLGALNASGLVAAGTYTLEVTQASSGAQVAGSRSGLIGSQSITSSNNTLELTVNGQARTVTFATGNRFYSELVEEIGAQLGSDVTVEQGAGNNFTITTVREGSAATVRVTGGTALAVLGMTVNATNQLGTNGKVRVNGGAEQLITDTAAGSTASLSVGGGTITVSDLGPIRVGSGSVAVLDTQNKSLQDVAAAVNAANLGVSAATVKQSEGSWYLQLTSGSSGSASRLALGGSDFATLNEGLDAQLTLGSASGALTATSATNTFSGLMPGVTITATAVSTTPVTVTVSRDEAATADAVQALLDTANTILNEIKTQTKFDPVNRTGGPLSGDASIRALAGQIRAAVTETIGSLTYSSAAAVGITTQRDGTFALDRSRFVEALRTNPGSVNRVFQRGGSSTSADVTFAGADENTVAGSYTVVVTKAPKLAIADKESFTSTSVALRRNGTTVTAVWASGATAAEQVDALNAAIRSAGWDLTAQVSAGTTNKVTIVAGSYGSAGSFELNPDPSGGGSWSSKNGVDVVGTIDGVAATGVGARLTVPTDSSSNAKGLQLDVAAQGTGTSSFTYSPGVGARLTTLIAQLTATNGSITTTTSSYDKRVSDYTTQISKYEEKLIAREEQLRKQWAKVQTTLSGLENQQNWLTNQIKGLNRES